MNHLASTLLRSSMIGLGFLLVSLIGAAGSVRGEDPSQCAPRARRVVITRARPAYAPSSGAPLGTFMPTPFIMVGGNYPTGSAGYSPLESYGDTALALTGPISAFRSATAPVLTYSRGYDGQTRVVETNSFSYPNLPSISPVVYPTKANYYWGPRTPRTPRWGSSAINWIDQN